MRARPEQRHLVLVEAVRPENWRTGQLKSRNAMLLVFLAFPCVVYQGFSWCLAGFVPKLVPIFRKPSQRRMVLCVELGGTDQTNPKSYKLLHGNWGAGQ